MTEEKRLILPGRKSVSISISQARRSAALAVMVASGVHLAAGIAQDHLSYGQVAAEAGTFLALGTTALAWSKPRITAALAAAVAIFSLISVGFAAYDVPPSWSIVHEEIALGTFLIAVSMILLSLVPSHSNLAAWVAAASGTCALAAGSAQVGGVPPLLDQTSLGFSWTAPIVLAGCTVMAWTLAGHRNGPVHDLFVDQSLRGSAIRGFSVAVFPCVILPLLVGLLLMRYRIKNQDATTLFATLGTVAVTSFAVITAEIGGRVGRRLGEPLARVAASAARIARNDFDSPRISFTGPTEVERLGRDVDTMRRGLEQRARIEALVREAIHAVSVGEGLATAFRNFGHAVSAAVSIDRASLWAVDDDGITYTIAATYGSAGWRRPVGSVGKLGKIMQSQLGRGEPVVIGDAAASTDEQIHAIAEFGLRSIVSVPILVMGRPRIIITCSAHAPDRFNAQDVALIQAAVRETSGTFNALVQLDRERETVARLEQLDDLKTEFVGMVAHDLRSPMNVIAGYADTMLRRWDELPDNDKIEFLAIISRSVKDLAELVEDVLQVARIESGELSYRLQPFDLAQLVQRTATEMHMTHPDRQIDIAVDENLPLALADEQRQWQIISNLLTNALKFSDAPKPVEISVTQAHSMMQVQIRDFGVGIRSHDLDAIFDRFARVEQPGRKARAKGTGLGLYICKMLVEAQGGTILASSTVGEGSVFTYTVQPSNERAAEEQGVGHASSTRS